MRSNTSVAASAYMCSRSGSVSTARMPRPSAAANSTSTTISGRSAGDSVVRAKKAAHGSGVRFEFLPKQFGEVRPDGTISQSPAAEFHPERDEILEPPLIREPVPNRGDPLRRFGHPLEDVVEGLWPAPVDDCEEYLLFVCRNSSRRRRGNNLPSR